MTREEVKTLMEKFFQELQETREAGQKEYAHDENNAFRNFEALAKDLGIERKKVLWTYLKKHLDGILAAINGHVSQREPVRGRIKDAVVYLILLLGMFEEDSSSTESEEQDQDWITIPNKVPQYPEGARPYNVEK